MLVDCGLADPRRHVLQGGLVDPMDDLVVMNPGRWVYVMSCILGRVEGVPGDGGCPRQLAQLLLTSSELKLRAEVGHLPVFPAFVPRGQAPMVSPGGRHRAAAALHVRRPPRPAGPVWRAGREHVGGFWPALLQDPGPLVWPALDAPLHGGGGRAPSHGRGPLAVRGGRGNPTGCLPCLWLGDGGGQDGHRCLRAACP